VSVVAVMAPPMSCAVSGTAVRASSGSARQARIVVALTDAPAAIAAAAAGSARRARRSRRPDVQAATPSMTPR
jgi:hypothetical protein